MDALGFLGSLASLKTLIPSLSFVGTFVAYKARIVIPSVWKVGCATVMATSAWGNSSNTSGLAMTSCITILVAPGALAFPVNTPNASGYQINFNANEIVSGNSTSAIAILFNY